MGRRKLLRGLTLAVAAVLPLCGSSVGQAVQSATTAVAVCGGHTSAQPTLGRDWWWENGTV
ncbi:hypothetical protein ACF061_37260 [Streptomyces sp. NPDC015220]|uniref:hypothetical protein n=1 Tax=Streptomyces sp. NPDC015220 TaxID=3364947 RepID=UPI0036FC5021